MICPISLLCQVSFSNSNNFALLNLSSSPSCLFVSFDNHLIIHIGFAQLVYFLFVHLFF